MTPRIVSVGRSSERSVALLPLAVMDIVSLTMELLDAEHATAEAVPETLRETIALYVVDLTKILLGDAAVGRVGDCVERLVAELDLVNVCVQDAMLLVDTRVTVTKTVVEYVAEVERESLFKVFVVESMFVHVVVAIADNVVPTVSVVLRDIAWLVEIVLESVFDCLELLLLLRERLAWCGVTVPITVTVAVTLEKVIVTAEETVSEVVADGEAEGDPVAVLLAERRSDPVTAVLVVVAEKVRTVAVWSVVVVSDMAIDTLADTLCVLLSEYTNVLPETDADWSTLSDEDS